MVFPSGNSSSLELLRDVPEQNFIHPAARAFGLALFVIATVVVLLASCWVVANRTNAVVVAAQPNFLYALCSASAIICPCMLLSAFDESWGFSNDVLDASCLSWVWLDAIGRMTTYGAIFTKVRFATCQKDSTVFHCSCACALLFCSFGEQTDAYGTKPIKLQHGGYFGRAPFWLLLWFRC